MKLDSQGCANKSVNISQYAIMRSVLHLKKHFRQTGIDSFNDVYGITRKITDIHCDMKKGMCYGLSMLYLIFALTGVEELYFTILEDLQVFAKKEHNSLTLSELTYVKAIMLFIHTINQVQSKQNVFTRSGAMLDNVFKFFCFFSCGAFVVTAILLALITSCTSLTSTTFSLVSGTSAISFSIFLLLCICMRIYCPFFEVLATDSKDKTILQNTQYYFINLPGDHSLAAKRNKNVKQDIIWTLVDSNNPRGKKKFKSKEKMLAFVKKKYKDKHNSLTIKLYNLSEYAKYHTSTIPFDISQENLIDNEYKTNKIYTLLYKFFGGINKNNCLEANLLIKQK